MSKINDLKFMVEHQANDESLWFVAETASEEYLQQELRKLHGMCEAVIKEDHGTTSVSSKSD